MLIVSDTGPLRYLIEISAVEVLPRLYESVLTTRVVVDELQLPHFPTAVRQWGREPAPWLHIEQPKRVDFVDRLDAGEASALSLAVERRADAILIDERHGTAVARAIGLPTIGTLAVLMEAGEAALLDFHDAIRRLTQETRFRHSQVLIDQVIADFEERCRRAQHGSDS